MAEQKEWQTPECRQYSLWAYWSYRNPSYPYFSLCTTLEDLVLFCFGLLPFSQDSEQWLCFLLSPKNMQNETHTLLSHVKMLILSFVEKHSMREGAFPVNLEWLFLELLRHALVQSLGSQSIN